MFRNAKLYKKSKSSTPRKSDNKKSKTDKPTFTQKVQSLISRNIENKSTVSTQAIAPVCVLSALNNPTWFCLKDWDNNVWKIAQGGTNDQRVGNKIKMKRWIIKGQIQPDTAGIQFNDSTGYIKQSYQGYITVYFGRLTNAGAVDPALPHFLDSGNGALAPLGTSTEMMLPVNKDLYKIYWRKTFKVGASYGPNASTTQSPNNDFALTRTFGFDVCKHILKNYILKFNDGDQRSSDAMLSRLAFWAVWRPAIGSMSNPVVGAHNHFYNINLTSYGEYEDA